jgi:hypothetical protein
MSEPPDGPPGVRSPADRIEMGKLIVSALGVIVTVGSLVYGVWTYFDQRGEQITQRGQEIEQRGLEIAALVRESKKKFLDKQFDLYVEESFELCRRLFLEG